MILSDNWLRQQSTKPTHILLKHNGTVEYASLPFTNRQNKAIRVPDKDAEYAYNRYYSRGNKESIRRYNRDLLIKLNDRMLEDWQPMIEPFSPELIRVQEDNKVISYGVSSYGYDLRIGNKFKIFTNVNSTVVNPKNFDERSFIDFEGDVCIVPPNSFVLAASIEKINMPRNVTGVVLGKSTYARCFTGDTRVMLADGTTPTFLELIERTSTGERFYGYSVSNDLRIVMSELILPRKIGHEKVLKVTLDSGEVIKCTPDHKFITREGLEIEAKDLLPGSSLFTLYKITPSNGEANNHKVVSVKELEGTEDVYCLTAPEFGNFALASGVFVNNCGLNCIATPLEAGWSGHVTLEYANTTPLPVMLFANEGAAQVLFFEGDNCNTSYADRGGKYQDQEAGPVLPRM